ncbi:hypothetical protein SVA_2021 [Sulfurifustis variabilis]|uniref:Transposase IS200-like domain-containing protein n=1 Tax=Sulfurifustis variabilis TaxID=1675686 RepID=A0A1B4V4V8_9GAMM|nr:hypothetical protein SVA_2021 [Sulfurifustis variabilis]
MPRRLRIATGGLVYHALNRRVGRLTLFETERDYLAFERILEEAIARTGIRLLAYCLMPNDWHLLLGRATTRHCQKPYAGGPGRTPTLACRPSERRHRAAVPGAL